MRTALASNRQKKVLRFFGVPFAQTLSSGAAGWEIAALFADEQKRDLWSKYVYLTGDLDATSDELKDFELETLRALALPADWSVARAEVQFREELAAKLLGGRPPFDLPEPQVLFHERRFMFTGRFEYGQRSACERAVLERGGLVSESDQAVEAHLVDYLVVGAKGNLQWSSGSYGRKIEAAIVARRDQGAPAIISEAHWRAHL